MQSPGFDLQQREIETKTKQKGKEENEQTILDIFSAAVIYELLWGIPKSSNFCCWHDCPIRSSDPTRQPLVHKLVTKMTIFGKLSRDSVLWGKHRSDELPWQFCVSLKSAVKQICCLSILFLDSGQEGKAQKHGWQIRGCFLFLFKENTYQTSSMKDFVTFI